MASTELATGYISLAISTKGLGREVAREFGGVERTAAISGNTAGRRFAAGFGSASAGLASVAKRGIGGLAKIAAGGAVGVAAIGAAGVVSGVKIAAGMETAKIGFETMLGSGKKADKFLRDLQKFAAKTPFEFPELQKAASSLISAGVAADDVIPIMTTLGDATAGMGTGSEGIQRATIALQQMNAAGRITAEDLNQLRDAGIPVYDLLAKATGKSKEEVVKLAASGKLGKKELDQLMGALKSGKGLERFNGLMAKTSKSLSGMFSTLKDELGQGLANAITPALPAIKDGLKSISGGLSSMFKTIGENKGSLTRTFNAAGRILKSFGKIAAGALGPFIESLTGGKKGLKGFADFLESNEETFVSTFVGMARGAIEFGKGLALVVSGVLRGFGYMNKGVHALMGFFLDQFVAITDAAAEAFKWIPGLSGKLDGVSENMRKLRDEFKADTSDEDRFKGWADSIDGKLVPALDAAGDGLDRVASIQLSKSKLRDDAAKTAQAIKGIGTASDGSQIKLKHWADQTKLGGDEQKALRDRIASAKKALDSQLDAVRKAEGGQKQLTKAWETGKERLTREFKQMGLSNKAAKALGARYAGIKPKVETKFTQPGMKAAIRDTGVLDRKLDSIKGTQGVNLTFSTNAGKVAASLKKLRLGGRVRTPSGPKPAPVSPVMLRDGGQIIGRGGPREDNIAGIDKRTGIQTAWVSAKEFVVNARDTARNLSLLRAINAGKKIHAGIIGGRVPKRASGGSIQLKVGRIPGSATDIPEIVNASASAGAFQTGLKFRRYGIAGLKKLLDAANARKGGGDGGYKGPVGRGAAGIRRIANSFNPSYIAGHRDPQGGPAFDIGSSGRKNTNIGNALRSHHGGLGLRYVIRQMQIASGRGGWGWRRYTPITNAGDFRHVNHVHVSYRNGGLVKRVKPTKFDQGGKLEEGLNLTYNGTRKPEALLTKPQWDLAKRAINNHGGGQSGTTFTGPISVQGYTVQEVAREFARELRHREALAPTPFSA